ncbi:MAG TPA: hypothetical protein VFY51_12515 [Pyrinomonadaceae bacterium]|nr:hypothetical protein [Pyrinomonadaceae bacterium]
MNHSHKSLFLILAIVLFSAISICAQAPQDNSAAEKEKIDALREKAYKLLDTIAGQLTTLQSSENRARMGANILDSLWKHDEERARSLLRVVQEDIKTELQKHDGDARYDVRFQVFLKLRYDTVERIAKHDGQAALDFLQVTEPVFENQGPYEFRENEQALKLRLAKQVATNNPDVALKLGLESLKKSLDPDVLKVLNKLNRKHKEQAHALYKAILEELPDANMVDAWHVRDFVQTLVQAYEPPDVDESMYRALVGRVVSTALEQGCTKKPSEEEDEQSDFCRWAATTLRNAEKYDSRVGRIKHWKGDYDSRKFAFIDDEVNELLEASAYDQLEALAAKHPELQAGIYHQAILHARSEGKLDQARKMIDRFPVDDHEMRQMLVSLMERMEQKVTITDEKMAEIQAGVDIVAANERVQYLLATAGQLVFFDEKASLKFLNQASQLIDTMKPGKEQTQMRLALAMMYSQLKSDRAFAIMESLVPKLNELVEIAAKLDGYDTNYLRDGEWNMSANGSVGEILTTLSQQAGGFAWSDFDRAVSLASQFERPEIRMMAHLKLAQAIVDGLRPRLNWRGRFSRFDPY